MVAKKKNKTGFSIGNTYRTLRGKRNSSTEEPVLPCKREKSVRLARKEYLEKENQNSLYFIAHKGNLEDLMNNGFRDHLKCRPKCSGNLILQKINQHVISTDLKLVCSNCDWKGVEKKMYQEYKCKNDTLDGSSTLNTALGFALLNSGIGATVCLELFLYLGLNPGSRAGLQRVINSCGDIVNILGQQVINETRQRLKEQFGHKWVCTFDTMYNNRLFSNNTPFAGGTQAISTAVEEMSGDRLVVSLITASKLKASVVKKGKNKGEKIDKETLYLQTDDNIADEGFYSFKMSQNLKEKGIAVCAIGADADSTIRGGVRKVFPGCILQQDTKHFSKSQKNKIKGTEFSDQLVKEKQTEKLSKQRKKKKIGYLAQDIAARCTAEFNRAHSRCKNIKNVEKLKTALKQKTENLAITIVNCYQGNHDLCKKHSFVCQPPNKISNKKFFMKKLYPTASDKSKLIDLVNLRLGEQAIDKTFFNLNTQKCESLNRSYIKSNPKAVTFTRNFRARVLCAVIKDTLGFQGAVARSHMRTAHVICSEVKTQIETHSNYIVSQKSWHKTVNAKKARVNKISQLICTYEDAWKRKNEKNANLGKSTSEMTYQKDMDINMDAE